MTRKVLKPTMVGFQRMARSPAYELYVDVHWGCALIHIHAWIRRSF